MPLRTKPVGALSSPPALTSWTVEVGSSIGSAVTRSRVMRSTVALMSDSSSPPSARSSRIRVCAACMVMTSASDGSTAVTRRCENIGMSLSMKQVTGNCTSASSASPSSVTVSTTSLSGASSPSAASSAASSSPPASSARHSSRSALSSVGVLEASALPTSTAPGTTSVTVVELMSSGVFFCAGTTKNTNASAIVMRKVPSPTRISPGTDAFLPAELLCRAIGSPPGVSPSVRQPPPIPRG